MTTADRERRRLTVGRLDSGPAEVGPARSSSLASPEDDGQTLQDLLAGKDAVSVCSTTDEAAHRKKEFDNKDVEVIAPPGLPKDVALEELVGESPIEAIAYKCHKGKKPESPNQDSFSILLVKGECALYCVYDGHGPDGHKVSEKVRKEVVVQFYARILQEMPIGEAFKEAFVKTQHKLEAMSNSCSMDPKWRTDPEMIDASMSGTTCTMVYHDFVRQKLHIAHVGDSRAALGMVGEKKALEVKALTIDHKPELPEEKERIVAAGGRVVFDGFYNHRVFAKAGHYPGLNMSRALGDVVGHKEAGLSAEPDVKEIDLANLKSEHEKIILLLCTDGVWEFVENEEAVKKLDISTKAPVDPQALANKLEGLTLESYERWMKDSVNEISDDITGIAVIL